MARCDVVLLASSVWRLAPQESVQRTVGSVKGAEGAELKESARERTAVKPPTPFDAQAECKRHAWVEGGAESEASGPKAAALGKRDGQRTKEQRGARTPAHAKVGGATAPLAGLACSPLFAVYQTHTAQTTGLGALPVAREQREP